LFTAADAAGTDAGDVIGSALNIPFPAGAVLRFSHGGTGVTGAGFNMSFGVEMLTGA
jgi:hypothetical protein